MYLTFLKHIKKLFNKKNLLMENYNIYNYIDKFLEFSINLI